MHLHKLAWGCSLLMDVGRSRLQACHCEDISGLGINPRANRPLLWEHSSYLLRHLHVEALEDFQGRGGQHTILAIIQEYGCN